MKATEKIVSNVLRRIISDEEFGWPPECWGTFYQPERPVQQKEAHNAVEEHEHEPDADN